MRWLSMDLRTDYATIAFIDMPNFMLSATGFLCSPLPMIRPDPACRMPLEARRENGSAVASRHLNRQQGASCGTVFLERRGSTRHRLAALFRRSLVVLRCAEGS